MTKKPKPIKSASRPKTKRAFFAKGMEYRFRIDVFTPDTLPMARLAEYMAELARLLGEPANVHFKKLERGSAVLVQKVDWEAAPKVRERTARIRRSEASPEEIKAFSGLNVLLRQDNATAYLQEKAEEPNRRSAIVLRFPGREEQPENFTMVRQHGSIDGFINRIGGRDQTIHVGVEQEGRQLSGCHTTLAVAKELRHHLFQTVRLFGRGKWGRDDSGKWTLEEFKIETFQPLEDKPLTDALAELRSIPTEWSDESYSELEILRHGKRGKTNGGH